MKSTITVTLNDYIRSEDLNELSMDKFKIPDISMDGDSILDINILNDYIEDLLEDSVNLHLSADELKQYSYRPRLLAYRLYDNPNYYYLLLLINNMASEKEFNRTPVKIIKPDVMVERLSAIYNTNSDTIKYYKHEALKKISQV